MRVRIFQSALLTTALLSGTVIPPGQAGQRGVSLSQTRVIFNTQAPCVTVAVRNHSDHAWLTRAQVLTAPDGTRATPFMVTPPLFRLEPDSHSAVRILRRSDAVLPADRESVYYLSVLAIPPSQNADAGDSTVASARVTVGIDSVIKLFYRPAGLTPAPQAATQKLIVRHQGDGVTISNPTPYYQTLASFSLDGKPVALSAEDSMIAPFSSRHYSVTGHPREARWSVINDFGRTSPLYHTAVSAGAS